MDLMVLDNIEKDKQALKKAERPSFATVVDVNSQDYCKIKIDGDAEASDTYYSSLYKASVGDRVYIAWVGNSIVVQGSTDNHTSHSGTIDDAISNHNLAIDAHMDIRSLIGSLTTTHTTNVDPINGMRVTGNNVCKVVKNNIGVCVLVAELTCDAPVIQGTDIIDIPTSINASKMYGAFGGILTLTNGTVINVPLWNYGTKIRLWLGAGTIQADSILTINLTYML